MKRHMYFLILIGLAVALAACSTPASVDHVVTANPPEPATGYPAQPAATAAPAAGYPAQPQAAQPTQPQAAQPTQPQAAGYPAVTTVTPVPGDIGAISGKAAAELAKKLSVDVTQIQVTQAEATDWPDSSLGCPQPGMAYTQVETPGYRVVLTYKQTTYEYHANKMGLLVLCQPK